MDEIDVGEKVTLKSYTVAWNAKEKEREREERTVHVNLIVSNVCIRIGCHLLYGRDLHAIDLSGATEPRKVSPSSSSSFHLLKLLPYFDALTLRFVTHLPICLIVFLFLSLLFRLTWFDQSEFETQYLLASILHTIYYSNKIKFCSMIFHSTTFYISVRWISLSKCMTRQHSRSNGWKSEILRM